MSYGDFCFSVGQLSGNLKNTFIFAVGNVFVEIEMKQKVFTTILQWLVSLFCWLTVSPLFCYLAGRWKLMGKKLRVCLMLISPLFLIVYFILYLLVSGVYYDYRREHRFADKEVLERITGVAYPDFEVVKYTKGEESFLGDYHDELTIEFKEMPSAAFYQSLDSLVATDVWFLHDNVYSFSAIWGNGFPAPQGESEEEDMMFDIHIEKGSKQAVISYGAW